MMPPPISSQTVAASSPLHQIENIAVFCASAMGADPEYARAAAELGRALASRGIGVVYGGSKVGLMRVVAEAALQSGGPSRWCDSEGSAGS